MRVKVSPHGNDNRNFLPYILGRSKQFFDKGDPFHFIAAQCKYFFELIHND